MSTLLVIWLSALATMVGIALYARHRLDGRYPNNNPYRLHDLASKEAHLLLSDTASFVGALRPHGARALRGGLFFARRGQDFFIARVYGKMKVHKGSASSFFLKQIKEHQGQGRGGSGREM